MMANIMPFDEYLAGSARNFRRPDDYQRLNALQQNGRCDPMFYLGIENRYHPVKVKKISP
jgi:hypothetical protein